MAELLTTNVFYQNTVREYSGNVIHQIIPENSKKEIFTTAYSFFRRPHFIQEDTSLQYRQFTYQVFKNSNILNEAWQELNCPAINRYYGENLPGCSCDDAGLQHTAEKIIQELASLNDAKKILRGILKKEPRVYYHSIEVMCIAMIMAQCVGYDAESIYDVGMAAVLHDISKVLLPNEILHLASEPNNLQLQKLQKIPVLSAAMAKRVGVRKTAILEGILSHKENYIGTGYPASKMQEEIHPYAMIIHIADDYDSMITDRKNHDYIKNYIKKMACRRYSFTAVTAFNNLFK